MANWTTIRGVYLSAIFVALLAIFVLMTHSVVSPGQASLILGLATVLVASTCGDLAGMLSAILCFGAWSVAYSSHSAHKIDWFTFAIFIAASVGSSRIAAAFRNRTYIAEGREAELALLFEASETISREIDLDGAVSTLSRLLKSLCRARACTVWRIDQADPDNLNPISDASTNDSEPILLLAKAAAEHKAVIGFDKTKDKLWLKGISEPDASKPIPRELQAVYLPLTADNHVVGVLHVGSRLDKRPFNSAEQRLILTLANHLAFVLARDTLSATASQAAALRESDRLKDSLMSMVSHELRSPLAAIKATASTAKIHGGEPESLDAIIEQSDRLTELVSNLLDLSRLEAGAWKPEKDWCDVGEIVSTSLDRLPEGDASRVNVKTLETLPLVHVDYIQIALALTNLLQNAFKYAPTSSHIDLNLIAEHNGSDERPSGVIVQVRDYGKGIPSGEIKNLFERFYRLPEHRRNGVSGTGLGLALVKSIVCSHGGRVWAANPAPGEPRGAVFTIVLPLE